MSNKNYFVHNVTDLVTQLAQVADVASDRAGAYFDRGYNSGGADAITDADISSTGLTAAQFGDLINLMQQFDLFMNNGEPLQADWMSNANKARTDLQ